MHGQIEEVGGCLDAVRSLHEHDAADLGTARDQFHAPGDRLQRLGAVDGMWVFIIDLDLGDPADLRQGGQKLVALERLAPADPFGVAQHVHAVDALAWQGPGPDHQPDQCLIHILPLRLRELLRLGPDSLTMRAAVARLSAR